MMSILKKKEKLIEHSKESYNQLGNMNNIIKANQQKSHKHMLGKRVSVIHKGEEWIGTLTFSGWNRMLNCNQVTLDTTPLINISHLDMGTLRLKPLKTTKL